MKVVYPACFYPAKEGEGQGYTVIVPDLQGCVTEGFTLSDAINMAQDAIGGWLYEYFEENKPIPKHSDIKDVVANEYENGFVTLIMVDMDIYMSKDATKAVKKTLSIPAWLNNTAEKYNVNFSQILQKALIKELELD